MIESLLVALEVVAPLFLLMVLGYVIKLTGLMNETTVKQVNKTIFTIFLPVLVFLNIYNADFSSASLSSLMLYAVVGILIQFTLSLCISITAQKDNSRRGVMLQGMFRSNFVLFGIPVSAALFGTAASGAAAVLTVVIIPLYNVLAVLALQMFNGKQPSFSRMILGMLTNPLIIASVLGIIFNTFSIPMPGFLYDTVSDIAGITTPLAFIILGASFSFGDIGKYAKELIFTLGAKLLIYPAIFIGVAILLGFRGYSLAVLLTVFGAPIAVSSFSMAQQMGGDEKLAGQLVVWSSLLSVGSMFLFIFLLRFFGYI